jgi:hypothetical protein
MGVMDRANQKLGGGGDWLDKDELIRLRVPLAIVGCDYDPHGTSKFPGANWIVSVEPWEPDKFPGPTGKIRFANLPTRQAQFEDIKDQLDEAKEHNVTYIGPVAVVSGAAQSGNRFKTLADVLVDDAGNIVTDSRGFARIDGQDEPPPTPTPTPAGPRVPTGRVQQQSTGQRERVAVAPPAAPAAVQTPAPTPAPQPAPEATTPVPATPARRRGRPPASPAADPAAPVSNYEAQQQAQASAEPVGPPPGQPELAQVIPMATAVCPFCQTEIGPNRVYPSQGGGHVIMHAHCPVKQDTVILPVMLEESA